VIVADTLLQLFRRSQYRLWESDTGGVYRGPTVFLVAGQAVASEVPPRGGLIASWLLAPPAMSAIAFWLDRRKQEK
jgi:hypothetical protein